MRTTWSILILALFTFSGATALAAPSYLGVKKCKKCHLKQFKSWKNTKMAKAFEQLKPNTFAEAKTKAKLDPAKDYTKDAKCLACHTTGYGKPGGYGKGKADQLSGVGCESCHGPGSDYVADDKMSKKNKKFKSADLAKDGFVAKPTEKQCTGCHNKESPFFKGFDFAKAMKDKKATHEHFAQKEKH